MGAINNLKNRDSDSICDMKFAVSDSIISFL